MSWVEIVMALDKSVAAWFRQSFAFANDRSSWQERGIGIAFLLLAGFFAWLSFHIDLWKSAVLWGAYVLGLAICSRQGWIKLFGPVLFYDMVRTARRSRYVIMRMFYAVLLLVILTVMFLTMELEHRFTNRRDTAVMA